MKRLAVIFSIFCLLTASVSNKTFADDGPVTETRSFRFTYDVEITGLQTGDQVRAWIPEPSESEYQIVRSVTRSLPGASRRTQDKKYGNRVGYFATTVKSPDSLHARLVWDIDRSAADPTKQPPTARISAEEQHLFLQKNRFVPVGGEPAKILLTEPAPKDALQRGRFLFDLVAEHMKYDKSRPGYGNGDAVWACNSQFGNCTDFHSLFISLARGLSLPARFEIGFSIPGESGNHEIGGYHCWAYFSDGKQWVPVDISDGDKHPDQLQEYFGKLNANRVAFTTGRDLILEPAQSGEPLNYLIYPYVEVNGTPLAASQIVTKFTSEDR